MARRHTSVQVGSVGFYALLGGITAFIISGAIQETVYVALGALVGAGLGWLVRQVRRGEARSRVGRLGAPDEDHEDRTKVDLHSTWSAR
jgi:hypothetical protein